MAWYTWSFGALMVVMGTIGLYNGKPTETLIMSGAGMITLVVGIMVAGKVAHDKGKE